MIREAPVQGAENGSWEAPKRQSAAWKEENVIGSPCTFIGERDCERRGEVEGAGVIGGATEGDEVVWKDRAVLI